MRASDFVARLGGDEFVAVLLQIDAAGVEHWYRRLRERLRLPGSGEDPGVPLELLSLSAGATRIEPAAQRDGEAILQQADAALYRAKQAGRDTIRLGPDV
jgi:diguanylate cyclase (GGDEF)-like protein